MSSSVPYDAIRGRLVDLFGATYPVLDFEEIEVLLQQQDVPFLALDDSAGATDLESIGTPSQNWTRDRGAIIVHIFVPSTSGGGLYPARNIGDQIRSAMRFYRFPAPAGETLRCLNVDPPGPGAIYQGRWHSMMVAIDYEYRTAVATAV